MLLMKTLSPEVLTDDGFVNLLVIFYVNIPIGKCESIWTFC